MVLKLEKNNFRKTKKMPQFFHATNLYDLKGPNDETRETCETRDTGEQWFQTKTVLAALRAAREQKVFFIAIIDSKIDQSQVGMRLIKTRR